MGCFASHAGSWKNIESSKKHALNLIWIMPSPRIEDFLIDGLGEKLK
jgi:hypothetical protein